MTKVRCDVKYRGENNMFVLSEVVMSFKFATLSESGVEAVSLQTLPSGLAECQLNTQQRKVCIAWQAPNKRVVRS